MAFRSCLLRGHECVVHADDRIKTSTLIRHLSLLCAILPRCMGAHQDRDVHVACSGLATYIWKVNHVGYIETKKSWYIA